MIHFYVNRMLNTRKGKGVRKISDESQKQGLTELELNGMNITQRAQSGRMNSYIFNKQKNNLGTQNSFY